MQNLPDVSGFLIAVKLLMSANLLLMTPITLLPASRALEAPLGLAAAPLRRGALRCARTLPCLCWPSHNRLRYSERALSRARS